MNSRLPTLRAGKIIKVLGKLGFKKVRQSGSHIFFGHPDGRATIVPNHAGEDIGRGLLRRIMKEAEISPEEFSKYL